MGTTLTGKNISASYLGLLKTTDNAVIGGTAKIITDGNGNDSPLYLSTTRVGIGITPTSLLHVNGDANINTLTVGLGSGSISTNTVFGNNALKQNTTGYMNTAIGVDALRNNTDGDNNIAIGRLNLDANTSGIRNVALGNQSLTSNTTGSYNVGLGYDGLSALSSGGYNIGIGYEAGNNITTGTGSIMIGGVTRSSGVTSSNEIVIGYNTTGNGSNTVTIGNSSITTNYFSGDILLGNSENLFWGNTSDVYISGTTVSDNIQLGVGGSTQFTFSQASGLRLHQYGSGTITGTVTQRLGVDSSGNVIEIPIGSGAVDGSGTANTVTMWSDSDTITDAPITISGNNSTFAGDVTVQGGDILNASGNFTITSASDFIVDANNNISLDADGGLIKFLDAGSEKMRLDSSGNVGIGTTSPKHYSGTSGTVLSLHSSTHRGVLELSGASNSDDAIIGAITFANTENTSANGALSQIFTYTETTDSNAGDDSGGHLVFLTKPEAGTITERMRLDSSGRLGLGTSSPASKIDVREDANNVYTGYFYNSNTGSTAHGINVQTASTDADAYAFRVNSASNSNALVVKGDANVGIGTSSPSAPLSIQTSSTSQTIRLIGRSADGSSYIQFRNNADSSNYAEIGSDNNSVLLFNTNGSEVMRLDSSGKLGIGTSSPDAPLHILKASSGANIVTALKLDPDDATVGSGTSIDFNASSTNTGASLVGARIVGAREGGNASGFLALYTSPDSSGSEPLERMRIDSSGNLGIATSSPAQKLDISGHVSIRGTNKIYFNHDTNTARYIGASSANDLDIAADDDINFRSNFNRFFNGSTEFARLSGSSNSWIANGSGGKLGIGTTAPDNTLDVVVSDVDVTPNAESSAVFRRNGNNYLSILSNSSNVGGILFGNEADSIDGAIVYNHSDQALIFETADSERMRISSDGDVLLGTTGTPNGTSVYGSAFTDESSDRMVLFQATSTTTEATLQAFYNPNGQVGRINTSGSSTIYYTSSDYRLKEDLQDFAGLKMVSKIPVYNFKWKADDSRSYGVMAHELQEVLPQAVSGEKDAEDMQQVDYSKLVPILLKSIQELEARVKELEKEI